MSFKVKVLPGNQEFTVEAGQTVLDAALEAGIFLPYSCRNGTCSTCAGRIVSGTWDAGDAPGRILESGDLSRGVTLLCQARPGSDLVIEAEVLRVAGEIHVRKMPSRVIAIEDLAHDVRLVRLQLPASEPFLYRPGQFLDFIMRDGRRRSYSIANPPDAQNQIELHIRHMPGGAFTDHVFGAGDTALRLREILRVEGPLGSFFLREEDDAPVIFLASGTGFAPVKAIIESMIAAGSRRPATLYWGGRRPRDLYLHALAEQWVSDWPGFSYVPVVSEALPEDGWTGRTGFVHRAVMEDCPDLSGHQVYACGTPIMVESARHDFIHYNKLAREAFFADAFTSEADLVA
ncbi:MAG: CDP-6-deoxy-delta-3,4-glucoseen reductase [Castellaniella sp.]